MADEVERGASVFPDAELETLYCRLSSCPMRGPIPDDLQSDLRMVFNTARGDLMSGDSGAIIHTKNHGIDLLLAASALRAHLKDQPQ